MTTKITDKNISSIANLFVSWQSVITADGSTTTTGVAGRGYFINTTSAAHTFTLPTIATAGDTISIKDYAGTFASNKLTIDRNGHNIQGAANNSLIGTNRASVTLVYIDVTRGWEFVKESNVAVLVPTFISATGGTITTSGNFKIHSFTGDGCFVISSVGNALAGPTGSLVDYLVVAGGGGGGYAGGGGGAGGYRTTFPSPGCNTGSFPISTTTYPITVGAGGTSAPTSPSPGGSGSNSIFSTITSTGGGGGRGGDSGLAGISGGSGGGAAYIAGAGGPGTGGTGNTPPTSPSQGNPGGTGRTGSGGSGSGDAYSSGGGGGISAPGGNGTAPKSGDGGAGSTNLITGSSLTYSGGGGGAADDYRILSGGNGIGGTGGGGAGGNSVTPIGTAGTDNTGGGGGGGNGGGAAGGKGIVVIRYKFQ
jgi:hypothetical protein